MHSKAPNAINGFNISQFQEKKNSLFLKTVCYYHFPG